MLDIALKMELIHSPTIYDGIPDQSVHEMLKIPRKEHGASSGSDSSTESESDDA